MGFFNYDKPGPGVNPDAPKKKGIFLYFELLGRNFGGFLKTGMLYFAVSIPMILLSIWAGAYFVRWLSELFGITDSMFLQQAVAFSSLLFVVFLGSGPASASLSHFFRAKLREEHTYIFGDFFKHFKKNFKQGMIVGIIQAVATVLLLFCGVFYGMQYIMTGSIIWFLFMLIVLIVCLVLVMSGFYLYQLMITFDNTILELYKNALILALIKAPQNIGLMIILAALAYLLSFTLTPVATMVFAFIGILGIMRFAIDLYTARVIDKNILKKIKED